VLFLPDYSVSLAERLIPASDVSNQISTGGLRGERHEQHEVHDERRLTVGTRDGATIEMAQEAGEENFFLFGLTAEEVERVTRVVQPVVALRARRRDARGARPDPHRPFQRERARAFQPIVDALLDRGDHYMHLADLNAYLDADAKLCRSTPIKARGPAARF
jgi:starch phosphorylase